MSETQVYTENFLRGLQTTARAEGMAFPSFERFENTRVDRGDAERRKGSVLLDRGTTEGLCTVMDGATDYLTIPAAADTWDVFTGKHWTVEALCTASTIAAGTDVLLGWKKASGPVHLKRTENQIVATTTDSASATVTLTSTSTYAADAVLAIQLVRDGTDLTLRVNGVSEATGTVADLAGDTDAVDLLIGADGSSPGSFWAGSVDYVRFFRVARTAYSDGMLRFLDPRSEIVAGDWAVQADANDIVKDRSRFENHGGMTGSPSTAASLAHQHAPAQMIHEVRGANGDLRLLYVAGSSVYDVEVRT